MRMWGDPASKFSLVSPVVSHHEAKHEHRNNVRCVCKRAAVEKVSKKRKRKKTKNTLYLALSTGILLLPVTR